MKVNVTEMWVSSGHLVMKCEVWGEGGTWRQKRYAYFPLSSIPEEVMTEIIGCYMDAAPEEDHHQTALF